MQPTAVDNCGGAVTYNKTSGNFDTDPDCPHSGTYTNTWTATDICGNTSSSVFTQTITITDNTAPSFTTPAGNLNRTYECDETSNIAAAQLLEPIAVDNCGGAVTYNKSSGSFNADEDCPNGGTYTNTWTTTDICGNTSSSIFTQIITITDLTPPMISCPPDMTITYGESTLPAHTGSALAFDNCDLLPTISHLDSIPADTIIFRKWIASDACGNTSHCTQRILIRCTLIVTNTLDSGPGSLRDIIECADPGDTIIFDNALAGMTINITSTRIQINKNLTILSTLAPRVTIGSQIPGLFYIPINVMVEFRQLDMVSGSTIAGNMGAAIENTGGLKLHNVNIFRNPILPPGQYLVRNTPTSTLLLSGSCFFEMD
jgi:hypothetical protein